MLYLINSKSCLKFYEYGACGMATIAPRILPYSEEVDYTYADLNDFENKFKKLLKDKELRREGRPKTNEMGIRE